MNSNDANHDEQQLLLRVARGDTEAFAALFDLHAPTLNGQLLAAGHPPTRAEAILQRAFVALWVAAPRLRAASRVRDHLHHLVSLFSARPATGGR